MSTRFLLGVLAFVTALAFVSPAYAVTINGVDYTLFAKTTIKMEDGAFTRIDGNVGVNDVGGLLRIGALNTITGSATADNIFFGTGSTVGACLFNTSTGGNPAASCGSQAPAVLPITAWPPLPVPVVPACVNTQPDLTVPVNGVASPAPGCFGDVRLKDGAVLNLSAGTYNFKSLRMESGSILNGNGATVNLQGIVVTEASVTINDVSLTTVATGTFEAIIIGNNSHVSNSILYAPNARMHLHTGTIGNGSEFVAVFITVEPIKTTLIVQAQCFCAADITLSGNNINLTGGHGLNASGLSFFLATTCALDAQVACPGASCIQLTLAPGAMDNTATVVIPANTHGTFHLLIKSTVGQFCTNKTVTIP